MMHNGRFPDGGLVYPAMPFASYTKVTREDSDAIYAYLRSVPPVKQPNRPHDLTLSLQQPLADHRLAHAVLQGRRVQARPDQVGGVEPGRLSGRRPRPLRHVPHRDQRARRQFGIAGLRGRADPDAELVRAVAHLEQGGRPRRLEHRGDHRSICATASPAAARSTGRWRKSSTTACNI